MLLLSSQVSACCLLSVMSPCFLVIDLCVCTCTTAPLFTLNFTGINELFSASIKLLCVGYDLLLWTHVYVPLLMDYVNFWVVFCPESSIG